MNLIDVLKMITENKGLIDVCFVSEFVTCNYLIKTKCECTYNDLDEKFVINTLDDAVVIALDHINDFSITDESDDEFDQIALENGSTKLCLTFV